jgi:RecJ-like exonuclease
VRYFNHLIIKKMEEDNKKSSSGKLINCPNCKGSGSVNGDTCSKCDGTGKVNLLLG